MNWTNIALICGGIVGSLVVGLVVGRIIASIRYPDPDKPHIFSPKQTLVLLGIVLIAVCVVVFAIMYHPKPKTDLENQESTGFEDLGGVDPGANPGVAPAGPGEDVSEEYTEEESSEESSEESEEQPEEESSEPVENMSDVAVGVAA